MAPNHSRDGNEWLQLLQRKAGNGLASVVRPGHLGKKKATYVLFSCIFKADFLVMVGFAVVRMNASSSLFLKMLFSLLGLIKLPNFSANELEIL